MGKKKYQAVLYLILLVAVAGGFRLLYQGILSRRTIPPETKIFSRTFYSLCGHENRATLNIPRKGGKLTLQDLCSLYPARDGWRVRYAGKEVEISRTKNALCPSCRKKTHLGRKGDFLAVIRGPAGVDGGIIRATAIRLSDLPLTVRIKAQKGELDLPDEKALLQILDSLEENTD